MKYPASRRIGQFALYNGSTKSCLFWCLEDSQKLLIKHNQRLSYLYYSLSEAHITMCLLTVLSSGKAVKMNSIVLFQLVKLNGHCSSPA